MKVYNKIPIIILISSFFFIMGGKILLDEPFTTQMACLIFLMVQIFAISSALNKKVEDNIIVIFSRIYWYVYISMGIFYILYNDYFDEYSHLWLILLLIISTLFLSIGGYIASKFVSYNNRFFMTDIKKNIYWILLIIAILSNLYIIYSSGGILSFINSGYQIKYSNDSKLFSVIDKFFLTPFMYFNLIYVTGNNKELKTFVSRIYYVYQLIYIYISGSSLRILMMLISLCAMVVLGNETRTHKNKLTKVQKKWIRIGVVMCVIGVILAILIRFNRGNDTFTFNVLSQAYALLLTTSTFDSLYYLTNVLTLLTPTYSIGQLIFPLIFYLPRSIFTFKPTELGRIVALTFMNFNHDINGGFAATPMGEFYYDFGYIGVIIGVAFIGFLFVSFQRRYNINIGNRKVRLACILALMGQSISVATSWTTMGSYILGIVIFFNSVNFVNRLKSNK